MMAGAAAWRESKQVQRATRRRAWGGGAQDAMVVIPRSATRDNTCGGGSAAGGVGDGRNEGGGAAATATADVGGSVTGGCACGKALCGGCGCRSWGRVIGCRGWRASWRTCQGDAGGVRRWTGASGRPLSPSPRDARETLPLRLEEGGRASTHPSHRLRRRQRRARQLDVFPARVAAA